MFEHNLAVFAVLAVVILAILRTVAHRKESSWMSASRLLMGVSAVAILFALKRGAVSLYALALVAAIWGIFYCVGVLTKKKAQSPSRLK